MGYWLLTLAISVTAVTWVVRWLPHAGIKHTNHKIYLFTYIQLGKGNGSRTVSSFVYVSEFVNSLAT